MPLSNIKLYAIMYSTPVHHFFLRSILLPYLEMSGQCFLPAAKRQGHAELWVEKKRIGTYGFWDFETSVFSVIRYYSF